MIINYFFLICRKDTHTKILDDAKQRLMSLCENNFISIAKELDGLDPYQYTRAYSAGLQEFIEAFTFYEYIRGENISDWEILQKHLTYDIQLNVDDNDNNNDGADADNNTKIDENTTDDMKEKREEVEKINKETKTIKCLIQPNEYMLGIADMTGEVMRRGINSLGTGNLNVCFESSQFMNQLYSGFIKIGAQWNREMQRKTVTLRQSLLKTENVCYNIKVRGGEAAKWGTENNTDGGSGGIGGGGDEDEGFYA